MKAWKAQMVVVFAAVLIVASAYADTIDNPGSISFTSNVDSRITSQDGGLPMYLNAGDELILGAINGNGDAFFEQANISFDATEDANGFRTRLEATDDASGTYCPNSGVATITMKARIRVTKIAGTSIVTTPCFISINDGNSFTLTTDDSGSLTGVRFVEAEPKFVAEVTLDESVGGACNMTQMNAIATYYGLDNGGSTASIELFDAVIDPTNFAGDGC